MIGGHPHRVRLVAAAVLALTAIDPGARAQVANLSTYRRSPRDGQAYALIAAGEFSMGCVERDLRCKPAEHPQHRVRMRRAVRIGVTEGPSAHFAASRKRPDFARAPKSSIADVRGCMRTTSGTGSPGSPGPRR
jgi:formylglycine-generating enzyme required for sulfatase activity